MFAVYNNEKMRIIVDLLCIFFLDAIKLCYTREALLLYKR